MNAHQARTIAERWVAEEVARAPGETLGVFTHGSINWMADDDPFPASSDVDLAVVVPEVDPARHHPCKRPYGGIAIEAFYLPVARLSSVEALLADWVLAPNLAAGRVLFDRESRLGELQQAVRPAFAHRHWVRQRCRGLRDHALSIIAGFEQSDSLFYLNGVANLALRSMAQMALLAALRNPTTKKALVKARATLTAYDLTGEYQELLRLLRFADLDDETILRVTGHCRQALVDACQCLRTPFIGDNCVTVHGLPALDGDVPACVAQGAGRDIFLWVETVYVHALIALHNDAPAATAAEARRIYVEDMATIRSATLVEARERMLACRPALDRMLVVCDGLAGRHPEAMDGGDRKHR
jgi:hypothetical protein